MHESITTYLLPVLLAKVRLEPSQQFSGSDQQTAASEGRFVSLKVLTDILVYLIGEDQVYSPNQMKQDKRDDRPKTAVSNTPNPLTESSTNRLNVFLQQGLLPLINQLLQEADPIPFYAQRILSAILDRNQSFVALMRELGAGATPSGKQLKSLIQVICEFYMVNHPSLNKNTIKIMKALIDAKEMSFSELREYRIIDKTY
jgi:hypothetical protein